MKIVPCPACFLIISSKCGWNKTTTLFILSLIAFYHEQKRTRGQTSPGRGFIDTNINMGGAKYSITIERKDIQNKFGFSIDLIRKCERELLNRLNKTQKRFFIENLELKSHDTKWHKYEFCKFRWKYKYENWLKKYEFSLTERGASTFFDVPSSIIYGRKYDLTYSERLAIIWAYYLNEEIKKTKGKLTLALIAQQSGIAERTIRKAKQKYPLPFRHYYE